MRRSYFISAFVLVAAGTSILSAQTADTAILGRVADSSGSFVPKATVTIVERSTGIRRAATTGNEGTFEVRYLVPGEYSIEVSATGFRSERRTGVTIQIGQQARLDFTLEVGAIQQTLEVQAAASLLQTENATLGSVVGTERTVDLPLNGGCPVRIAHRMPPSANTSARASLASPRACSGAMYAGVPMI